MLSSLSFFLGLRYCSFHSKDSTNDGILDGNELACALASASGRKPTNAELHAVHSHAHDGNVTEEVFVSYLCERFQSFHLREQAREAFRSLDRRSAGCIDMHDFYKSVHEAASAIKPSTADDVFHLADADADGRISWRDFEQVYNEGAELQQSKDTPTGGP